MLILIVDDEKLHRESMAEFLRQEMPAVSVITAATGLEGLQMLENKRIDLAFVDIRMPVMSGLEMLARYRNKQRRPSGAPSFVILSGYSDFEYARQAIPLGVSRYLVKPVNIQELRSLLNATPHPLDAAGDTQQEDMVADTDFSNCLRYIQSHYMQPLSLEKLANMTYFSQSYFCTIFKRKTGMSFNKYLQTIRIRKAEEYLRESQLRVYEIAERVGYPDVKYFNRVFKNEMGVSPDEYRRTVKMQQLCAEKEAIVP